MMRSERVFLSELRAVDRGLVAPVPKRIRILRELEDDLESLRAHFLAMGLSPVEAHRRAAATLLPSGPSLAALDRAHEPLYRRMTRRLTEDRLRQAERALLATAAALVLLVEAFALLRGDVFAMPSLFLWPVLGVGAALTVTIGAAGFGLWVKQDIGAKRGARLALALAGLILVVGSAGALADAYLLAAALERAPDLAGPMTLDWLLRDGALLAVTLLFAMAGGLAWFVLTAWTAEVAHSHRDALGLGHARSLSEEEPR